MVESLLFVRKRSEAILWVSLFFAIVFSGQSNSLLAWQEANESWTSPAPDIRGRFERATHDQWTSFIKSTAQAILGETWQEDIGTMPAQDLPNQQRVRWLSERIEQWTQSRSFIQDQTQSWIVDRCGGETNDNELWDFRLHDAWVRNSISRNESFLLFVQRQLAGDVMFKEPEARLGTAAWFRCAKCLPSTDEQPFRGGRLMPLRNSPTLGDLPDSLKWTSFSGMPWLYWDASESQRARLSDLEASMISILRAEQRDWERLLSENAVSKWHRSQSRWPVPSPSDLTFNLSEQQGFTPGAPSTDPHPSYAISNPWRHTEPWTVVMEIECRDADSIRNAEPLVLVRQRSSCSESSMNQRNVSIEWKEGRICVRLIHSSPLSYLAIETEPVFQQTGVHAIAVVYEGFPSAEALRVWADGRWVETRAMHEHLLRDFASEEMQALEVASTSKDASIHLTQLESYRSALSAMELEGWRQVAAWKDWESCSEEERRVSCEHYARRVDLQWRYQRESLSFYADSFASVVAKVGMVPVAHRDPKLALVTSEPFAAAFGTSENAASRGLGILWNSDRRESVALDCKEKIADAVAWNEVTRQWQHMLASAGTTDEKRDPDEKRDHRNANILTSLSKQWGSSWDRRELIRAMIFSEAWVVTALDSPP